MPIYFLYCEVPYFYDKGDSKNDAKTTKHTIYISEETARREKRQNKKF